jgi:PadR family transcriptional regulator PadR
MDVEFGSFETELNRGFLQVLALAVLERKMYGYGMIKHLEEMGYAVDESTLYPLLRRLEKNGWIESEWDVSEDRPKKFYRVTEKGRAMRALALAMWAKQTDILDALKGADRDA